MKKGDLHCINVANYVHKVVFYDDTVLELKKKTKNLRTLPMGMLSKICRL